MHCTSSGRTQLAMAAAIWMVGFSLLLGGGALIQAQDDRPWGNKKAAVCLTYDDALNVHLDHVVPALDSLGFKATFYLSGYFPALKARLSEWRTAAENGHELGNHTLFHPCAGGYPGREWVKPDYDLANYTMQRLLDEIKMANTLLGAIDGKSTRTFAYPCGDTRIGDSSYVDSIRTEFVAARGVKGEMLQLDGIDLFNVGSYVVSGQAGDELIELVRQAMSRNALIVFLFHGVGGEHSMNVELNDHQKLLRFLKQNEKDVWVAPLADISEYVTARSPQKPTSAKPIGR